MTVVVALALALFPIAGTGPLSAQAQGLRIAVIAGEDAINIIQQKTAVAPIVEVRDRNNLPVAGIPVTFTIGGSSATFAGLQTVTVPTNAAGQAAAPAIDPVAPGKFQIKINASSGGETATTTITQTNVTNAAAAGAAAAAARAGSGQGGGAG